MTRLVAIAFIWIGCTVAWAILGSTLIVRTKDVSSSLDGQVHALWGPPGRQAPPHAFYSAKKTSKETVTTTPSGSVPVQQTVEREEVVEYPVSLEASTVDVAFDLEHRKKGLLWFPTYTVRFEADYLFKNPTQEQQKITVRFPLSRASATREQEASVSHVSFDDFRVLDAKGGPVAYRIEGGVATWETPFEAQARQRFKIAYRTRGTSSWHYLMTEANGEVKNLDLRMAASFPDVDFPPGTTSPTEHSTSHDRWQGHWKYASLISDAPIGIQMPQLLNPGPLASKVTFFAPLSLLFFFFVVAILAAVQGRQMHPMHYLLLGCAFFAFHLLFAYLVDRVALAQSFLIASLVSLFLVTSYARLFVGWRFALREMGLAQLVYLVLFSYTFFWEGFTGLAITIGAIVTLFIVMQITGKLDWAETLRRSGKPEPSTSHPAHQGIA